MNTPHIGIMDLRRMKQQREKITMLTAYDYPTARIEDESGVDSILVGDSAANVVLGYSDTVPVTMDEMIILARAVRRGVRRAFLIGDMPFMSYNVSIPEAIANAGRFIKEAGCDAVKLEGGGVMVDAIRAIGRAGVAVVGHLGLTPQTASLLGGYKVQGKDAAGAMRMLDDALAIQEAGAVMLVLEMVPAPVAADIARRLAIPVIGIGAGADVDGQVLVVHDMLGMHDFRPKFVKTYAEIKPRMAAAFGEYINDVKSQAFPGPEHRFALSEDELAVYLQQAEVLHGR